MAQRIYCFSGLGADGKIFRNVAEQGFNLVPVEWIPPLKNESIAGYADRMSATIEEESPVMLGVSFGGMMAIEIANRRPVRQVILISSVRSRDQLPTWMRWAGRLRLNRLLPTNSYKFTDKVDTNRIGAATEIERQMVRAYRRAADPLQIEWAIQQILNWNVRSCNVPLLHIHGDNDRIFPLKYVQPDHVIKGGTHMMIYNKAAEIAALVRSGLIDQSTANGRHY